MSGMRRSPSEDPNRGLKEDKPRRSEGNVAWLKRHGDADGIILLGGSSLADFRVRVAQSHLRHDLLPSHWSFCGILLGEGVLASVPFDLASVSAVPACNGVRMCPLADYDDPKQYPNVAVIRFAEVHEHVRRDIDRVRTDRSLLDLPALMLPWLGYIWGVPDATNPLPKGIGLPSAAFVETVFAMAGFELTPGLSSASSCPEAIWQSAKWWTDYYEAVSARAGGAAGGNSAPQGPAPVPAAAPVVEPPSAIPMVPSGAFVLRQRYDVL